MSTIVNRYFSPSGEVLWPLTETEDNTSDLFSTKGAYYMAQTTETAGIVAGNPMGLLLTLTYSGTP